MFIVNLNNKNITNLTGEATISSSLNNLGSSCSYTLAREEQGELGDILDISSSGESFFTGINTSRTLNKFTYSFKAFDFSFYLKKNKVIKQFKKLKASECIKQLAKDLDIKTGEIPDLITEITNIYRNKTASSIILEILEEVNRDSGDRYFVAVEGENLNIRKLGYEKIDIGSDLESISKNESINNMKNTILVSTKNHSENPTEKISKDSVNISKYGALQEVILIDPKESSQASNIAKNKLKELNKVSLDLSFNTLGNSKIKPGMIAVLKSEIFEIDGEFYIESVTHKLRSGIYTTSVTLGEYADE